MREVIVDADLLSWHLLGRCHAGRRGPRQTEHAKTTPISSPRRCRALPAVRYGAMSPDDCYAELTARQIAFTPETARGVLAPIRLDGPLHGVTFQDRSDESSARPRRGRSAIAV